MFVPFLQQIYIYLFLFQVGTTQSDTTYLKDPGVTEGSEYRYRVKAVNEYGISEPLTSDPVTARCPYGECICSVVRNGVPRNGVPGMRYF